MPGVRPSIRNRGERWTNLRESSGRTSNDAPPEKWQAPWWTSTTPSTRSALSRRVPAATTTATTTVRPNRPTVSAATTGNWPTGRDGTSGQEISTKDSAEAGTKRMLRSDVKTGCEATSCSCPYASSLPPIAIYTDGHLSISSSTSFFKVVHQILYSARKRRY